MSERSFTIVGQGLAGTCLAWELWQREFPFTLIDREEGGSSRVAAGLINPVTGKNFEPSPQITTFLPQAMEAYASAEQTLDATFWHPLPIIRFADSEKNWDKMQAKAELPEVMQWITEGPTPMVGSDWRGRIILHSGGRLDTRNFLDASREFFARHDCYKKGEVDFDDAPKHTVWCDGAVGLMTERYGSHRCAKGEILTVQANWPENTIRTGAGGWLIPIGEQRFRVGATYEWDPLDEEPTEEGRQKVKMLANQLGGPEFEIIDHEAGIRPILRRSQPLIGPIGNEQWMFNALGSKGSLYAPGIAKELAAWLVDGEEAHPHYDIRKFEG
ncbi:MAG: FAD-dependent oxidoreductase [Akkermansiaceae bacterium]|nr:FAD-dependent oxidoreductase [Akkermansiaceae bacterium]